MKNKKSILKYKKQRNKITKTAKRNTNKQSFKQKWKNQIFYANKKVFKLRFNKHIIWWYNNNNQQKIYKK